MAIIFFLLLFLIVVPLSLWLVASIWKTSSPGARASFLLLVPIYYWAWQERDNREIGLRPALIINLCAFVISLMVGYKAFEFEILSVFGGQEYAQEKVRGKTSVRVSSEDARWCKEQNDATYDPALKTCVENSKEEALARSQRSDLFGRLGRHLEKRGIKGELDTSRSANAMQPQLVTPEIARVTAYYFLPLSMSQPPVSVLLCISEAACMTYEEKAKERGAANLVRNTNLLLVLPPENAEDVRFPALKEAFLKFKPV